MRITIEFDERAQPITGRLEREGQPPEEFEGMLELVSLLEGLRAGSPPGPGGFGPTGPRDAP